MFGIDQSVIISMPNLQTKFIELTCCFRSLSNSGIAILLLKSDIKDDDRNPVEQYYWFISQAFNENKSFYHERLYYKPIY
jgi:hypothetical protein